MRRKQGLSVACVVALAIAGMPAPAASQDSASKADPKVWDNYDFIPGSKVIFYTDFSEDKVGNFARGLKFKSGQMDVVERDGVKMLRSTARSEFLIPVGKKLPERFTLEFDVITPTESAGGYDLVAFEGGPELDRGDQSAEVNWQVTGTTIIGGGKSGETHFPESVIPGLTGQVAHIRVLMDGPYLKLYTNERRIYNIPEFPFRRDSVIRVVLKGSEEPNQAPYLTSIRVAESEVDVLYDALTSKGRWATQGILFETGKADLKPESRPVLKEIASTMQKYPDLKILIEGHTDNVGSAASNLALSDARAAAVKAALVADFKIAADRMTTKGFGDTKPSVPNTTPAGKAQNRRVEIVKQ
jgi:outer membrane protein OmpA-like peptidoglycan-associated protein